MKTIQLDRALELLPEGETVRVRQITSTLGNLDANYDRAEIEARLRDTQHGIVEFAPEDGPYAEGFRVGFVLSAPGRLFRIAYPAPQ